MENLVEKAKREFTESCVTLLKESRTIDSKNEYVTKTGTTIIGVVHDSKGVIAADTKASAGFSVATTKIKKLRQIGDNYVIGGAGGVGAIQQVMNYLEAMNNLYKMENGEDMTADVAKSLTADIIAKSGGVYAEFIFVGKAKKDNEEYISVFSVDGGAGYIGGNKRDYLATGSGEPYVTGVMEDLFNDIDDQNDVEIDLLVTKAVRGVQASKQRDLGSGGNTHVYKITLEGIEELTPQEIEEYKTKKV